MSSVVVGQVLGGKYRVDKVLGEGGMGVVVAATHMQLDQHVAIKFMLPAAFADPAALARFAREARAAVKLRSEHVARVLDTGTFESGAPYIVMEFLEGTDLAGEVRRGGPIAPQLAAEYIVQACDAIAEAHALGIVHRDLKPANLFLTRRHDGTPLVKVLDFGISKATSLTESGLSMTKTSAVMGSPLYMSPEQMRSAKDVDARTDVWSLGIILYELLSGDTPFQADTLGALMATVLTEPPPPLATRCPGLPPPLGALVDRCLVKDRAGRVRSVGEIAQALRPFCPPRSQPIVERVVALTARSSVPTGEIVPAPPPPSDGSIVSAAQTGNVGWGATGTGSNQPRGGRMVVAALGALFAFAAVAGVTALRIHGRPKDAGAQSAAPATIAPPTAAAAVAAAMAPVPATASEPPSAPAAAPTSVMSTARAPAGGAPLRAAASGRPAAAQAAPARPTAAPHAVPTSTAKKPGLLDTSD